MAALQRLSLAQAAVVRGVQPATVASYLAEAVLAGMGYYWPPQGVPCGALLPVKKLANLLLPHGEVLLTS